jgi:antitoxin ParD1/3/4
MSKNTSILLGEHFDQFINSQVKSGKFTSASEVVRAALRLYEEEERKKINLINELKIGEQSGFIDNFNPEQFLAKLRKKHLK